VAERLVALPPDPRERTMARYFFHITNGHHLSDETGTVLDGIRSARREALLTAGEILCGDGEVFLNGNDWTMRVTDEAGTPLFTLRIAIEEHSGSRLS
jgi:hypothetical protein